MLIIVYMILTAYKCVCTEDLVYNILLLGGNGLLGSATVESLLDQKDVYYNITVLNRGNWYWNTESIVKPFVNHMKCSREDGFRDKCTQLSDDTKYEAIVDFSAYDPLDIEDILIILRGRFKRYIYISSDSVYEVCARKKHVGYSKEVDAIRPINESVREEYNSKDKYGHMKLEGEEVLEKFHKMLSYDYVALRLPDVIGPRDNTNRFWKFYMWAKINHIVGPVHIPPYLKDKPLMFVYSLDVGRLIAKLVHPGFDSGNIFNRAFNLGFKETITLKQFVEQLGECANSSVVFDESQNATKNFGFPSVKHGPVDINRAVSLLNWSPTKLQSALKETATFYENAEYSDENKFIVEQILNALDVRKLKRRDFLLYHHERKNARLNKDEL